MSRLAALIVFTLSGIQLSAQSWCPNIGTQWWHTYSQVGGLYGHVVTTYTSDTLIDGVDWKILHSVATYEDLSEVDPPLYSESWSLFTRVEENMVLTRQFEQVDTLYRFDATIGDRWSVPFMQPQLTYVVTGTGVRMVDEVELGWLAVDVVTSEDVLYYLDTLVERFGFLEQYIDPVASLNLEPTIQRLRCYIDAEIDYHVVPDNACEVVVGVDERDGPESPVILWYDGGSSELKVQLIGTQNCVFQLLDIRGRVLDQGVLRQGITNIPASHLPNAVYLLRVSDPQGHTWTRKWGGF